MTPENIQRFARHLAHAAGDDPDLTHQNHLRGFMFTTQKALRWAKKNIFGRV